MTKAPLGTRLFYVAAGVALLLTANALSPVGLAWNRTESLPRGLYLARSAALSPPLARGDIACFTYQPPVWAQGRYYHPGEVLCKHVMGLPGDTMSVVDGENQICHDGQCAGAGKIRDTDSAGRPVPHVDYAGKVIPEGQYYLGSTRRPNSFDSRYLGFVPKNIIIKTIVPLLVE